jgi:hypothetical protein
MHTYICIYTYVYISDMYLIQLLNVIWKRIRQNPCFLDLFVVSEILDAVISLIDHPQVYIYVRIYLVKYKFMHMNCFDVCIYIDINMGIHAYIYA